ncbi:hypothetical protein HNV08_09670 [Winogradskyella eckloniae]|uniref:hypothetical protein n=1 Tax=Winogradskyella eckloniae TaxID=1089306 RepID=UPI001563B408|nr:hypothetical protein [Winogradskyella eckloniae]NRD20314.1 hypothetical protein [Winogradskyella eckloniae]
MSILIHIKNSLKDPIKIAQFLLALFAVIYLVLLADDFFVFKIPILVGGLVFWIIDYKKRAFPVLWLTILVLLIIDVIGSYFWVANHHFLLCFMVLSMITFFYHKRSSILFVNIQTLVVIVLLLSVFQKLFSSQFISGNFYYHDINQGAMFRPLFYLFPDSLEIANQNVDNIKKLKESDPNLEHSIAVIDIVPNLRIMTVIYAWLTILVEAIVALFLIWKPRSTWTHLFLIIMICGILFTKLETGFMSLLAICGLFLCTSLKQKLIYIAILMVCILIIMAKMGYH